MYDAYHPPAITWAALQPLGLAPTPSAERRMEFENLDAQFLEIMKQLTPPLRVERPTSEPGLAQYLELKRDLHGGSGGGRGGGSAGGGGGGRSGSGSCGGRGGSAGSGARCGDCGDGSSGGSSGAHGGSRRGGGDGATACASGGEGGGAGAGGGGGAGGSCVPLHAQSIATTLYNEAAALVPRMLSTTDPATLNPTSTPTPALTRTRTRTLTFEALAFLTYRHPGLG